MSKEVEVKPGIISLADYREDLEIEVKFETARVMKTNPPLRVNKKYTHIEIPEFDVRDKRARLDWEMQEIERCINGYDGMPGRYYFQYHHSRIKHKYRGNIRPDFRSTQLQFAKVKDRIINTVGLGLVMIKRRQVGMSWDMAVDNIYDATFNNDFDIGMNSKGEADSRSFFVKHKHVHRHLQPFLRAHVSVDRRDAMLFKEYDKKTNTHKGTGSSIISVAPTPTGHAGNQYRKLVIDEAGEQPELMSLWANAEDCLRVETQRMGTPFIFGTMGDSDKNGKGLMEFWTQNELYNLERFAFWGYNCMLFDEFGNDMIEDAIRWIIYERKRIEGGSQIIYNKFRQKYPLHKDDAFLSVNGAGVGNPVLLSKQETALLENPPQRVSGWMRHKEGGGVDFVPDPMGQIVIYERPHSVANGYVASVDPAEDDDVKKSRDTSNLSTVILARPYGLSAPKLVAEYTGRPSKLATYYEQMALLLQWYNNTKVLIELNKGGYRMKDWMELHYPKLLAWTPNSANSVKTGFQQTIGAKMSVDRKIQMKGLLDGHWESYWNFIPSLRFIEECRVFGADHADDDLATAYGWCLIQLQSDKRVAQALDHNNQNLPKTSYKNINGQLHLVNGGKPIDIGAQRTIKNPLLQSKF